MSEEESSAGADLLQWAGIVGLVTLSAMFSGLTLGLLSLDPVGLQIVIGSGDAKEAEFAKRIFPIRKHGNLLLCTLLLGNVSVNSLLSILMADLTSGFAGFLISTVVIVILGEIIPQAVCSRHGLAIGARLVYVLYVFLLIFLPMSYPISKFLDWVLGREMGTIYNKNELKKLLEIETTISSTGLTKEDATIMSGALDFAEKTVQTIMTPIDNVFCVDINAKLDRETTTLILEKGFSRIPVYDGHPTRNIVGLLYVKDLALLNPEDQTPVRTVLSMYEGYRDLPRVFNDVKLNEMLKQFKVGRSHLAVVQTVNSEGPGDPFYENVGIVTLEDIIEEILQDEILDEGDVYVRKKGDEGGKIDYRRMSLYRAPHQATLTPHQFTAVLSYLTSTFAQFGPNVISDQVIRKLIAQATVVELEKPKRGDYFLYQRGVTNQVFTLILQGKIEVRSGSEQFMSEAGPFTVLGLDALSQETFTPDFTARVISNVQLLRISRRAYQASLKATQLHSTHEKSNVASPDLSMSFHAEHFDPYDGVVHMESNPQTNVQTSTTYNNYWNTTNSDGTKRVSPGPIQQQNGFPSSPPSVVLNVTDDGHNKEIEMHDLRTTPSSSSTTSRTKQTRGYEQLHDDA